MIDAPRWSMRPVNTNTITNFSAQKLITRHTKRLCFRIQQSVLDSANSLPDHTPGRGTRDTPGFSVESFMFAHILTDQPLTELFYDRCHTRRAKSLVKLAPADNTIVRGDFYKAIITPSRVASERFKLNDFCSHSICLDFQTT